MTNGKSLALSGLQLPPLEKNNNIHLLGSEESPGRRCESRVYDGKRGVTANCCDLPLREIANLTLHHGKQTLSGGGYLCVHLLLCNKPGFPSERPLCPEGKSLHLVSCPILRSKMKPFLKPCSSLPAGSPAPGRRVQPGRGLHGTAGWPDTPVCPSDTRLNTRVPQTPILGLSHGRRRELRACTVARVSNRRREGKRGV